MRCAACRDPRPTSPPPSAGGLPLQHSEVPNAAERPAFDFESRHVAVANAIRQWTGPVVLRVLSGEALGHRPPVTSALIPPNLTPPAGSKGEGKMWPKCGVGGWEHTFRGGRVRRSGRWARGGPPDQLLQRALAGVPTSGRSRNPSIRLVRSFLCDNHDQALAAPVGLARRGCRATKIWWRNG